MPERSGGDVLGCLAGRSLGGMLETWFKSRWHRFEMGNLDWLGHDICVGMRLPVFMCVYMSVYEWMNVCVCVCGCNEVCAGVYENVCTACFHE